MPRKYTKLTKDDRRGIAENQVRQFEGELFGHELNLARLDAIPKTKRAEDHDAVVEQSNKAIAVIEQAIATTKAEAAKLGGSEE